MKLPVIFGVLSVSLLLAGCIPQPSAGSDASAPIEETQAVQEVEAANNPVMAVETATQEMDKASEELEIPASDELSDDNLGL